LNTERMQLTEHVTRWEPRPPTPNEKEFLRFSAAAPDKYREYMAKTQGEGS
jgi:hypothetical protein